MRITSMELAGSSNTTLGDGTPGLPRAFARISRRDTDASSYIDVTILTPDGERKHSVHADCEEDIWSMAECLQRHLDGHVGTKSEINDYYRELQRFAD